MSGRVRWFRAAGRPSGSFAPLPLSADARRSLLVVPLLGLVLGGCDDLPPPDTTPTVIDMAGGVTTAYDDQFIGFWGIKAKISSIQTLPFFGDKGSTNTVLSVVQFRHDMTGKLVLDQQECQITVVSEAPQITTTVPDKIAETTPLVTGAVQVSGGPGALHFSRDQVATGIGCHLTNPFTDPLPTDKTDPKIFDQDGDGKLAVTVMPQTPVQGEVYVAQRRKYSYVNGLQQSATRYTGAIVDRSEQYILDADNTNLKAQVPSRPVDATSSFEMVKLTSQYPCTQLRSEAATLFSK